MYSVVLMMALSGGAETPDFGHRGGCHGCSGGCYGGGHGCSGCWGGCYGGGHGCHGGRRHGHGHGRRHGCHGGCAGGCYGGGYGCAGGFGCAGGCYGGGYGCAGGFGGGCAGGYGCAGGFGGGCAGGYGCAGGFGGGCAGGYGCAGGVIVPGTGDTDKKNGDGEKKDPEQIKKPAGSSLPAPATILVNLPANAKLLVDGAPTASTSSQRRLVSPELPQGREFRYTLTAEVNRNGQTLRQVRPVTVRAGQQTSVQFTFTEPATTASR
jgi:uncharacterized protein (TIGR03000 family)